MSRDVRLVNGQELDVVGFEITVPSFRTTPIESKADVAAELVSAIERGMIVVLVVVCADGSKVEVKP